MRPSDSTSMVAHCLASSTGSRNAQRDDVHAELDPPRPPGERRQRGHAFQDRRAADEAVGLPDRIDAALLAQIDPAPEARRRLERVFHQAAGRARPSCDGRPAARARPAGAGSRRGRGPALPAARGRCPPRDRPRASPRRRGARNTVIESVAGSRPAGLGRAGAAGRQRSWAPSRRAARGNQPSQNSTTRFSVWSVSPPSSIGGCGFCFGLGYIQTGSKLTNSPWNSASSCGPQRLHRQHALAQQLEARVVAGAVVLHLLDVPAAADGEDEAAARELVEAGDRFRGDDRVALRHQADAGAELERFGRRGGERQRDERIVRVRIALRQLAAAGERRTAAGRDMRVLADEQRFEAARLRARAPSSPMSMP